MTYIKGWVENMTVTIDNFPYFNQLDNELTPYGSCNVTSIAMCLYHFGVRGDNSYPHLPDQLNAKCNEHNIDRHDPNGLATLVNTYYPVCVDNLKLNGNISDIRYALNHNHPVVIHGYFTKGGHIIVLKGYNDKGFIVNDPYGEYFSTGYDTSVSGEGLVYSEALIEQVCSDDSKSDDFWMHIISKR